MRKGIIVAALLLATLGALAGETVTRTDYDVVLYPADGAPVVHFNDQKTPIDERLNQCVAAAPVAAAPGVKSRCHVIYYVTKVAECDKEPPPFPVEVDADGFLKKPALRVRVRGDGTWEPTEIEAMVPGPGYPECWVRGWVRYVGQDFEPDPERVAYVERPDDIRPEPLRCDAVGADPEGCIDPAYRESCGAEGADQKRCTDTGPVDGPGEGPGKGTPADKPA